MNAVAILSPITATAIIQVVADYYGVTPIDITSERRTKAVVLPRHVGMYLAKTHTTLSYPQIGQRFGWRDHSTVISAVRSISEKRRAEPRLAAEIAQIEILIEAERKAKVHFGLTSEPDIDPIAVAERVLTQARGEFSVSVREIIALSQAVLSAGQPGGDPIGSLERIIVAVEAFTHATREAAAAPNGEERTLRGEARNRAFTSLLQTTGDIRKEFFNGPTR